MRIAQRIQQSFSKKPDSVTLDQQRVKFETVVVKSSQSQQSIDPEEERALVAAATVAAKKRWLGWIGTGGNKRGK